MLVDSLPLIWVDAILIFTLCEWLILSYRSRKKQSGLSVGDISFGLLPGFLLMLALRFAAPPDINMIVFVCLSLAGIAHACDFCRRYKQQRKLTETTNEKASSEEEA